MQEHNDQLLDEIGDLLATHYEAWKGQRSDGPEVAFGRYLAATRRQQDLSIAELAQCAGVPESEILAYEHGLIPQVRIKAEPLQALATALREDLTTFLLILGVDIGIEPAPIPQQPGSPATGHRFIPGRNQTTARLISLPISPAPIGRLPLVERILPPIRQEAPPASSRLPVLQVHQVVTPLVAILLLFCVGAEHKQVLDAQPMLSTPPRVTEMTSPSCLATLAGVGTFSCPSEQFTLMQPLGGARPLLNAQSHGIALSTTGTTQRVLKPEPSNTAARPVNLAETGAFVEPVIPSTIPVDFLPQQPSAAQSSNPVSSLQMASALPTVHMVGKLENLWCIAKKYYDDADLYPLICQYNFGEPLCSQTLHPGDLLTIPVWDDFAVANLQIDPITLPLPGNKLNLFKGIEREVVNANQQKIRGVDYWCEEDDEKLVRLQQPGPVAQASNAAASVGLP